ncbi:MobF family relaxase [Endozoicomonas sp. ONNA1]|uniref:MobF family relaxase n=1 Tax=Endozoicomonas sp. ONNA1 TaxID=2828740 RepID=UPI002148548D|nr:MobF family relaxase [Endozoicomonas sp. ONNA1]
MISLQKISSSGAATNYFKDEDYYAKGDDESTIQSEWQGEGAKELGLEGKVDIQQFKNALEGKFDGVELGRSTGNGDKEHTKGWDVTFSAPKSVSILALAGGDKRLVEAHKKAVSHALGYIEKNMITTRVTMSGQTVNVNTENLAAASFTHTTSRDLDPQLHTHNVVLNVTKRQDGELRSLDSRTIYDNSMLAGQVYRSELAKAVKDLGYDINVDNQKGFFEISSVPKDVIKNFSKRREAIKKAAEDRDIKTTKGMQAAALATRKSKQKANAAQLINRWDKELADLKFDPNKAINESREKQTEKPNEMVSDDSSYSQTSQGKSDIEVSKSALDDVRFAYKHLSEKEAVFLEKDIFSTAIKASMGNHSTGDISTAIDKLVRQKEIIKSSLKSVRAFTTPAALKTEKYTIDLMRHGQKEVRSIASLGLINDHLEGKGLEKDQEEAVRVAIGSRDRVVAVQGYAGTGKTFMLSQVREIAEASDYKLQGAAFSATAAGELEKGSGIKSQTLASFINDKESLLAKGKLKGSKEMWVVDEASLINSKDMASLLTLSRKAKSRVVLVGDKAQIGAIEWGKPFHQLMDNGMKHAEMKTIRRQRNRDLLKAVKGMINKTPIQAMASIKNDIKEVREQSERIKMIADEYLKLRPEERKNMLIVIPDNETRQAVMTLIRDGLKKEGILGQDKHTSDVLINRGLSRAQKARAQFYNKGDVVEFGKDQKRLGVKRSERFKVDQVKGDTVVLKSNDRKLIWNPSKVAGSARNGVEVYREQERKFAVGDTIRWKKNLPDRDLRNGDTGKVLSIEDGKVKVGFQRGGEKTLDTKTDKHMDHNYAVTAFASQGMTFDKVAVMAESWRKNLINQASFYVGISRARDKAMIFTEDSKKLTEAISERSGEKSSAVKEYRARAERAGFDKDGLIDTMKDKAVEAGKKISQKFKEISLELEL